MLKWLLLLASCVSLTAAELRFPPMPGDVPKASLTNLQSAIRTMVALDVQMALLTHTNEAENVAYYFRHILNVFTAMPTNGTFAPEQLRAEINAKPGPLNVDLSGPTASILTMYDRAYQQRSRADVPPLEFLSAIATTFASAIREGAIRANRGHVFVNN